MPAPNGACSERLSRLPNSVYGSFDVRVGLSRTGSDANRGGKNLRLAWYIRVSSCFLSVPGDCWILCAK